MIIIKTYILFDLEALGENKYNDFMEIIEIAAHKVIIIDNIKTSNEYMRRKISPQFLIIDSFHTYISPVFHTNISKKMSKLLNIDMEALKNGLPYDEALYKFIDWAGENVVFLSWSNSDKIMIEENNRYLLSNIPPYMEFKDLQKAYDRNYHKSKRTGLNTAVEEIGEMFDGKQHNAVSDSINMLPILKNIRKSPLR